jgi:hypothetical protein
LVASNHQWQDTLRDMQAPYGSVVVVALPRPQTSAVTLSKWDAFGNRHPVATLRGTPKWAHTHPAQTQQSFHQGPFGRDS